jgi:hypothetical protein
MMPAENTEHWWGTLQVHIWYLKQDLETQSSCQRWVATHFGRQEPLVSYKELDLNWD